MDRAAFFNAVRPLMPAKRLTRTQVAWMETVLDGLASRRVPRNQAAYILATAHHESDHWRTMEEYASGAAYEGRKTLGNTQPGDGKRFKGRGLVQITGRRNYTDWAGRLRVNLIIKPELAATLKYAVPILIDGMLLGTFTGRDLGDYVSEHATDYVNARRVVNGTDRAHDIAARASKYASALSAAGYSHTAPSPVPGLRTPANPETPSAGILGGLWAFLKRILGIAS